MNRFLTSNEPIYRCLRTIAQGVLGVVVAQLPQVLGLYQLDPVWSAMIVAITMAVLSPVMAMLGGEDSEQAMLGGEDSEQAMDYEHPKPKHAQDGDGNG